MYSIVRVDYRRHRIEKKWQPNWRKIGHFYSLSEALKAFSHSLKQKEVCDITVAILDIKNITGQQFLLMTEANEMFDIRFTKYLTEIDPKNPFFVGLKELLGRT